jgi:transposase-like protein
MEPIAWKSDGRRVYSAEFKRQQIERVVHGEATISELSRELGISRNLPQRRKQLITVGDEAAVAANENVVPASELRAVQLEGV